MLTHIIAFIGGGALGAIAMSLFCAKGMIDLHGELGDLEARIDRALDKVTDKSAYVGRKMAAILKGEE